MQILKNLSKPIIICLHIIALVFMVLAIVFCYSKQLFSGNKYVVAGVSETFKESINYTISGLVKFSNNLISFSSKNTILQTELFKDHETTLALVSAAKTVKGLAITIMIFMALYLLAHLFSFRSLTLALSSLVCFILFAVLINFAKSNFENSKLILGITKYSKSILTFLALSCGFNMIALALRCIVKYSKA